MAAQRPARRPGRRSGWRGGRPCPHRPGRCRARWCRSCWRRRAASRAASRSRCSGSTSAALSASTRMSGVIVRPWRAHPFDLVEQRPGIDHDAVADDRELALHHARRQQRELVGVVADHDGVAGVVAALEAHHHVGAVGQPVDDLALALVAPLGADHRDVGHGLSDLTCPAGLACPFDRCSAKETGVRNLSRARFDSPIAGLSRGGLPNEPRMTGQSPCVGLVQFGGGWNPGGDVSRAHPSPFEDRRLCDLPERGGVRRSLRRCGRRRRPDRHRRHRLDRWHGGGLRAPGRQAARDLDRPWRFDQARNAALALVPDDVDICVSLDLDELIMPGWRRVLEGLWKPPINHVMYTHAWSRDVDRPVATASRQPHSRPARLCLALSVPRDDRDRRDR